jgi:hypothetical protein
MGRALAVALCTVIGAGGGCGPVAYISQARSADEAIAAARRADAEKLAPYYWTLATQYFHEAKLIAGHADFQAANRFGRLATEAAEKAVTEAKAAAKDPSKLPLDANPAGGPPGATIAPAKEPIEPSDGKPGKRLAPAKDGAKVLAPAKDASGEEVDPLAPPAAGPRRTP